MLGDPTESATTLPFSAGETGACRYEVSTAPRDEVLYHAFVYLRYILSDRAPEDARLLPTLNLILREPHRLWRSHRRDVRIEALTKDRRAYPPRSRDQDRYRRAAVITLSISSVAR